MSDLTNIVEYIRKGDLAETNKAVAAALADNMNPETILEDGLIRAMEIVGKDFSEDKIFLPEMLVASKAMNAGMEVLKPHLKKGEVRTICKAVIGTVQGDLHDIGKNLVATMMEGVGIEVVDIGIDVSPDQFVAAVEEHKPQLLGISALLTTTMPMMGEVINSLEEAGLRSDLKIFIGGAPVTHNYSVEIGADHYCANAGQAAETAKRIFGK